MSALRRTVATWRLARLQKRLAGPKLLRAFAATYPDAVFVEIGANDGEQHDHIREHIVSGRWSGVLVEPVPYVFRRLLDNYVDYERVHLDDIAIGARRGRELFYYLRDADAEERKTLPDWYDGIGSFDLETILSHAPQIPDIADRIESRERQVETFEGLCTRHELDTVDLIVIDTEGHDWEILRTIELATRRPRLVIYEHFHLSPGARAAARAHMERNGYATIEEGFDTFCLRPGFDDELARTWARVKPAVPGVSKHEETGALPLHDESIPLPVGANEALRADSPYLAELREAYGALDLPVTRASRWSADRVGAFLDLRWYRGETLITWHYRDDPETTARRYRAWYDDVVRQDVTGLLGRLKEDGLHGCWTHVIDRRRVSRDLLESVVELTFLDRELGIADWPAIRVLDVGAGYGRLAHRMAEAYPETLADYACIDAVPESAFVCEYHLRLRRVAPPARVARLDELSDEEPGTFGLAVNVHSFSEMPHAAVAWWLATLARLEIPRLLLVPNEPGPLLSLEPDGSRRDCEDLLVAAGYVLTAEAPVVDDPEAREITGIDDVMRLYERR